MSSKMLLCVFIAAVILPALVLGGPITSVVVYGDSLSDNGNLYNATGFPGSPYYMGRRSDGPVAVEYLAGALGVPLHDFAWAGATTGTGNYGDGGTTTTMGGFALPGMTTVFDATKSGLGAYTGALFVVWGGPNDVLAPSPLDTTAQQMIGRSITNIMTIVGTLQVLGATDILVPGMPDLGLTPYLKSLRPDAAAQGSAYTDAFNAALVASLPVGVKYFDTASLLRSIYVNPAAYGLTNVTTPCFNGTTVCADPGQYLFFDDFHPTTKVHSIAAQGFASTVPEPGSAILLVVGLGAVWLRSQVQSRRNI